MKKDQPEMMQAVVYKKYGPPSVLQLTTVQKPTPKDTELLIKVHASTVTAGTLWIRKGLFPGSLFFSLMLRIAFGLFRPRRRILGFEFSGVVEQIGNSVKEYNVGDAVYGTTTGLPGGAYASYVCVPENWRSGVIDLKPALLTHNEAAALPIGAMTALQLVLKTKLKAGQSVLVYGGSGSVGTYAIQIAASKGAFVKAASSAGNLNLMLKLGAQEVLDYQKMDFEKHRKCFDVVIDAVGKIPAGKLKLMLKSGGRFASVTSYTNEKKFYLRLLHQMINHGQLLPVIDGVYSLSEIAKAHEYVETGRKKGNVIIEIVKSV